MSPCLRRVIATCRSVAGWEECTRDCGVELRRESGTVRLVHRVVLADELGRTNPRATEPFGGRVLVRKEFDIDSPPSRAAILAPYLYCERPGSVLSVRVNGHLLRHRWLAQREYWQDSWTPLKIPARFLIAGRNEVVFSGAAGAGWALLLEHTRWPRRSAKSLDGGRTWNYTGLGGTGAFLHGEYLVRLAVPSYASTGTITSAVLDLALLGGAGGIAAEARVLRLEVGAAARLPQGTSLTLSLRWGPSPSYDPATWSAWQPAHSPPTNLPPATRFVQWRAVLATERPQSTPALRAVTLAADLDLRDTSPGVALVGGDNPPVVRSSHPFAHQPWDEPRLALFRRRWPLDEVVRPDRPDFGNLVALREWTRRQWEDGWNRGPTDYVPPWDGFVILELASRQLSLGMCTHYTTAFVHACAALGFTARTLIMRSHCIPEVWSDEWRKRVAFDHSGDTDDGRKMTYHLERDGVPLSALEIHQALVDGTVSELRFAPPEAGQAFRLADRVRLFERFCLHFRNDEMSSLEPGEPEHGARSYHYDEYLWWTDQQTPPAPWFSRVSSRVGDFAWTLNHAQIHLQHAGRQALRVWLDTEMPNFDTFLRRFDDGAWESCGAAFRWPLHRGHNRLETQVRNRSGRRGFVSSVEVLLPGGRPTP